MKRIDRNNNTERSQPLVFTKRNGLLKIYCYNVIMLRGVVTNRANFFFPTLRAVLHLRRGSISQSDL
jgi:hypothetical protein